ncbi:MAG: CRISPR-associated endoribonuclease Cas6 [Caldilineaceae bacterium]|nr:CRISPR-associated endoribonuclease Cas6 [Caldilineaceae bacterium]MCB0122431.1 CRISPR-associated endoribonuclease Cas6 [Caldilineaceae bacterium]
MTQALHAIVINLIAQEAGSLPGTVGELAHAAFYAAIDAVDPALAQQIHDAQNRKAFSLSPLYGYWQSPQDGRIHVSAGQPGWLRLGLLDETLFGAFMQHILYSGITGGEASIRLGRIPFTITEAFGAPGSHPWVGYTSWQELAALEEAPERWVVEFLSPTAIRWGEADNMARRVELFPTPRLTIASLRTLWDRTTGAAWGRDFEEWVDRNIVVGRIWQWQTEPFRYKKQTYIGGTGKLEYRVLDGRNRANVAHFNRLLQLAFYAGVGYKTTHGLGQMRIVESESREVS